MTTPRQTKCEWALCLVALGLWLTGAVQAKTINVAAGQKIQTAIDAAVNGDVVVVAKGTYKENIDFKGKAITVKSTYETDPSAIAGTTIDGDKKGSVVTFKSGETRSCTLGGFTIRNGSAYPEGGGILCSLSSPTIRENVITGNAAHIGAGICVGGDYMAAASLYAPLIVDNVIQGNHCENEGGGINVAYASSTIVGNIISQNTAMWGGGINLSDGCVAWVCGNVISANTAANGYPGEPSTGGGISCGAGGANSAGNVTIQSNTLIGNAAPAGGGLYLEGPDAFSLTNNIVVFATVGGGIHITSNLSPQIRYCDVYGNVGGDYVGRASQTGKNGNISVDPLFANAAGGNFRLKSQGGRWNGTAWIKDTVSSPCIDAGDPASAFALEPAPNGGRINMGYDGNTAYASKNPLPAPVVSAHSPIGTNVSAELPTIAVTFSAAMNKTSAQGALSISPAKAGTAAPGWPGTFSWLGNQMKYKLNTSLAPNTTYTVKIATSATGAVGLSMAAPFSWTFTTNNVPAISLHTPLGDAVALSTNRIIQIVFNQPMDKATTQAAFKLSPAVAGQFLWFAPNELDYFLQANCAPLTTYAVSLAATARSAGGVALGKLSSWSFKTGTVASASARITVASAPTAAGAQLSVSLSAAASVEVTITNIAGRPVATLPESDLPKGVSTLLWSGKAATGLRVPSGTYLARLTARTEDGEQSQALTMVNVVR